MTTILDALASASPWLILTLVFLLPALEASTFVGLIVPGETMIILGGVAAHAGRVTLTAVILLSILGTILGDQVGFSIGRRYGPLLVARLPPGSPWATRISTTLELLRRRGSSAVALGRWIATLRSMVPAIAGMSGMNRWAFTAANILGGSLWAVAMTLAGYLAGASFRVLENQLGTLAYVMTGLLVASTVMWWLWSRRRMTRH